MSPDKPAPGRDPTLCEPAPAKLNLFLHVTGRRDDGYHLLDSLFAFVAAGDEVSALPAADLGLETGGPFAAALDNAPGNLVIDAARALAEWRAGPAPGKAGGRGPGPAGARISLIKNLPVAAGMGGGSADAAATLRLLVRLWKLDIGPADLAGIALKLGADVPACLESRCLRVAGIGDRIKPAANPPDLGVLLVNPRIAVPTAAVFKALRQQGKGFSGAAAGVFSRRQDRASFLRGLRETGNDLEGPACRIAPEIGALLDRMKEQDDCLMARMTGSGATCFGLFETPRQAVLAARVMAREKPDWWICPTEFLVSARPGAGAL